MGISEFLDAPDGAVLVAIGGEVALVTTHHETPTKLTIERFALGPVVPVEAVLVLLRLHGLLPVLVPAAPLPVLPAPDDRPHVCPDCGKTFSRDDVFARHRKGHGLRSGVQIAAPVDDFTCPECAQVFATSAAMGSHRLNIHGVAHSETGVPCTLCPRIFKNQHARDTHLARAHRGAAWSTKPAVTGAAVAALMTPPAPGPDPPVSVDVAPLSAVPVTSELPISKDRKVKGTPVAEGACPVCHEPLMSHEQCGGCGVLIGAAHVTARGVFIGGATYCRDCAATRIAARNAGREAT